MRKELAKKKKKLKAMSFRAFLEGEKESVILIKMKKKEPGMWRGNSYPTHNILLHLFVEVGLWSRVCQVDSTNVCLNIIWQVLWGFFSSHNYPSALGISLPTTFSQVRCIMCPLHIVSNQWYFTCPTISVWL